MNIVAAAIAFSPIAFEAADTKIIAASLFKNGYAVVTREAKLSGAENLVFDLPRAVMGTLWITATPGVKLRDAVVTSLDSTTDRDVANLDEFLGANVGANMTLILTDGTLTGTLRSSAGNIIVIETTDSKQIVAIQKGLIQKVMSDKGSLVYKMKQPSSKPALRVRVEGTTGGSLYIVSLERGMTWAPAYAVDITDPKRAHVVAKATVMNDLGPIEGIELRLITGFPNMPFINLFDPLTTQENLYQWADRLMQTGTPDQLRRAQGFGGQMARNAAYQFDANFDEAFPPNATPGIQNEDLFFYRLPAVTLKTGDRGYYIQTAFDSDYEHIYEWQIDDKIQDEAYRSPNQPDLPNDVWHSIRFKNNAKQPLSTASAVTMKDGEILGQDMLTYTSPGAEARVKITKAMDVRAEDLEEEIDRKRQAATFRGVSYDLVTLKGTLSVTNRKAEDVKLEITKDLTGEVKSADGPPKITAQAKGLRAVNPKQKVQWTTTIKPGEKKVITYTYTVYVTRL